VLGNETAVSASIRRFFAGHPDEAREVFGDSRLPTLVQYDPASRFFEVHDGTLVFTADGGIPLIRYRIADEGGVLEHAALLDHCARHGFTPPPGPELPFVFLFGRSLFTVSFFGANVHPENVTVGLEQPGISDTVTGKFVIESVENEDRDRSLRITVETAPGATADAAVIAEAVRAQLLRLNSEFAHYVPAERQLPEVVLRPAGDPEYFPAGVKHKYTRRP
jgi:phenylacetate-CoA ligase